MNLLKHIIRDSIVLSTCGVFSTVDAAHLAINGSNNPIPSWYTANRIQLHWVGNYPGVYATTGSINSYPEYQLWLKGVHSVVQQSGANATVGLARFGAENNWRVDEPCDTIGFYNESLIRNDLLNDYHSRGLKVIAYYRHDMDYNVQRDHPEWLCRDRAGAPISKNRGMDYGLVTPYQICQNSPYRAIMQQSLVRLAQLGSDGIYFDEDHMPEACYCSYCQVLYKTNYGVNMPMNAKKGSQAYHQIASLVAKTLATTFEQWKAAIQSINPECVLLVSTLTYNQINNEHHNESLERVGSAVKTEFQKCFGGQQYWADSPIQKLIKSNPTYYFPALDLQESTEWMIARDVKRVPPHIWVDRPDPLNEGEFFHSTTAVVAHGAIASLNISPINRDLPLLKKIFALNNALSPYMQQARPYCWAAVYVPHHVKDQLLMVDYMGIDAQYKALFEEFYSPVLGAVQALQEMHYPFGFITDNWIEADSLNPETKVIIVPNMKQLDSKHQQALNNMKSRGITLISLDDLDLDKEWFINNDQQALRLLLENKITQLPKPMVYSNAPKPVKVAYHFIPETQTVVAAFVRNWDWFWILGAHTSKWSITDQISNVKIMVNNKYISRASLIDFPTSLQLDKPLIIGEQSITLPDFDYYNFVSITLSDQRVSEVPIVNEQSHVYCYYKNGDLVIATPFKESLNSIYNSRGQVVWNGFLEVGRNSINLPPGIYFIPSVGKFGIFE